MYFSCERQPLCLKRCYINFPNKINKKYELFICNVDHFHIESNLISIHTKKKIESLMNLNVKVTEELLAALKLTSYQALLQNNFTI